MISASFAILAAIPATWVPWVAVIDIGMLFSPFIAWFISSFVYKVPSLKPSGGVPFIDWSHKYNIFDFPLPFLKIGSV